MTKILLDERCKKIFAVLLVTQKKMRFNELKRTLKETRLEMPSPTLIRHLRHLCKKRLLIRKEEDFQNVSYTVNWKKLEHLADIIDQQKALEHLLRNKKIFESAPMDDQTIYLMDVLTLRNLHLLRAEILSIVNPTKAFEYTISNLYTSRFFELFKTWLLKNCRENKTECKEKALSTVEYNIKRHTDMLFEKISTQ